MLELMRVPLLLLFISFPALSAAFAQSLPSGESRSLGDVAREVREQRRLRALNHEAPSRTFQMAEELSFSDPEEYADHIVELLAKEDFDGLERAAERARTSRSRFRGGIWKLYWFYEALSNPVGGERASEFEWNSRIDRLKTWAATKPDSNTALIALAEAYLAHGYKARGHGYADTVSEEGWRAYGGNAALARVTLEKAARRGVNCPHWYESMMQVASAQGWSNAKTRALFEAAMSFDSSYYHTIREYSGYLLPKWYGQEGESEAFAKAISDRIGGEEGNFIYFEVSSALVCSGCGEPNHLARLSWPRIKQGYAALEHLYGLSNLKMNRFAFMAAAMNDREAASVVFSQIGDRWDKDVWKEQSFLTARKWALGY